MNRKKKIFFFCKFLRLSVLIIASKSYRLKGVFFKISSLPAARRYEKHRDSAPKSAVHLFAKTAD